MKIALVGKATIMSDVGCIVVVWTCCWHSAAGICIQFCIYLFSCSNWSVRVSLCRKTTHPFSGMSKEIMDKIATQVEMHLYDSSKNISHSWSKLESILLENKLAYHMKIDVDAMMVSPHNRGGSGISPIGAHDLGKKSCHKDLASMQPKHRSASKCHMMNRWDKRKSNGTMR